MAVTFIAAVYQISAKLTNLMPVVELRCFGHFRYLDCLHIDYVQSSSVTNWIR
jgi:hypothetical protein